MFIYIKKNNTIPHIYILVFHYSFLKQFTEMDNNICPKKLTCIINNKNDENKGSDKCSCGMPFNPRIVGGTEAAPNSVPWQVN